MSQPTNGRGCFSKCSFAVSRLEIVRRADSFFGPVVKIFAMILLWLLHSSAATRCPSFSTNRSHSLVGRKTPRNAFSVFRIPARALPRRSRYQSSANSFACGRPSSLVVERDWRPFIKLKHYTTMRVPRQKCASCVLDIYRKKQGPSKPSPLMFLRKLVAGVGFELRPSGYEPEGLTDATHS